MISSTFAHIPHKPGVYFFKDSKENFLYIGKAKDLKKRILQYFSPGSVWKQDMVAKAKLVDFVSVNTESEALFLEDNLIKKHKPPYNNLLKGDNSYVYIKITKEVFPQIFLTRMRSNDGALYLGPKYYTQELKKLLQFLRQLLQYRGCKGTQFRQGKLCSDYLFGMCKGRCVFQKLRIKNPERIGAGEEWRINVGTQNFASASKHINTFLVDAAKLGFTGEDGYEGAVLDSKKMVELLKDFFEGRIKSIQTEIQNQINECISVQNFERAAKLRDVYEHLHRFVEKQTVVLQPSVHGKVVMIKQVGKHRIVCVLVFAEWKLMDIIRNKELVEEVDIDDIKGMVEQEFGHFFENQKSKIKNQRLHETWKMELETNSKVMMVEETMKKIKKAQLGEIEKLCDEFIESMVISTHSQDDSLMNELLTQLHDRYWLKTFPYLIECVDISHLSGGRISGWLSAMAGGLLNKRSYRNYKIRTVQVNNDDYLALRELILRRFGAAKKSDSDEAQRGYLPDLFILDWGKGQLNVVRELLQGDSEFLSIVDQVQFVSLGKGEARHRSGKIQDKKEKLYVLQHDLSIKGYDFVYDEADRILLKLRDEAHRFANRYRKKQMSLELGKKKKEEGKSKKQ